MIVTIDSILSQFDFSTTYDVTGLDTLTPLLGEERQQAAIYVLHFADGACHVGSTQDIACRFQQHAVYWSDIQRISIWWIPRTRLDDYERLVQRTLLEEGLPLRYAEDEQKITCFDEVMPREEQQRWLNDPGYHYPGKRWCHDEALREHHIHRYNRFRQLPSASGILEVLRFYTTHNIPAYLSGEYNYWAVSCLPNSAPGIQTYVQIMINCQEVFFVGADNIQSKPSTWGKVNSWVASHKLQPVYRLQVDRAPLAAAYGRDLKPLRQQFGLRITASAPDSLRLQVRETATIKQLLRDPVLRRAIRQHNLALMRQGTCNSSWYHCLAMADSFFANGTN